MRCNGEGKPLLATVEEAFNGIRVRFGYSREEITGNEFCVEYGVGTWTLRGEDKTSVVVFEMSVWSRMERVKWLD